MKKLFTFLALVLGLVSCQTEPEGFDVNVGGEQDVNITVSLPEGTRANSALGAFDNVDFKNYDVRFQCEVHYNGKVKVLPVQYGRGDDAVATATFPVRLIANRDYKFVVWADLVLEDSTADLHYNTSAGLHNITINDWNAMDETRDAFTCSVVREFNRRDDINLELTRPFAKLRVITTDMKELMGIVPTEAKVEYTTKYRNSFDAVEAKAGDVYATKTHNRFEIASYGETGTDKTLFADYLFASEGDIVNFSMNVYDQNGDPIDEQKNFNTPIPVKRNYVTTIKGNILTYADDFTVNILPGFDGEEIVKVVDTAEDLQEIINNIEDGGSANIELGGDIDLGDLFGAGILSTRAGATLPIVIAENKTLVLDLNGFKITTPWDDEAAQKHYYAFENYGSLTIQDSKGNGEIKARGIFNYGTMTLESGIINACDGNGGYGVRNYEGAEFIMNGGSIVTSYEDGDTPGNGYDASPVRVDEGATATFNGGTINNISNFTVAIDNYGETTINGGTFTTIHTTIANSATMTINGGLFTCNGLEGVTAHAFWAAAGTATINGGTFDGKDNYNGFNVDASKGATVNIKGGEFLPVHSGSLYGEGTINVMGGVFFDNPSKFVNDDYTVEANDGNYTVVRKSDVAKIGEEGYTSLAKAVAAVNDGGTITLVADEVFNENNYYDNGGWKDGLGYSGDKSFTIDLNSKTIRQNGALNDYLIWIKNDGSKANTITLKNGTLDAGTTAYCAFATASSNKQKITINLENVNLVGNNSNGAVAKIRGGAELNVKSGTVITGKNNYVGIEAVGNNTVVNIYDNAEIYQNGTSSYVGGIVGASYNATMNIYGGYGKSAKCGIIVMSTGATINVSGGEWIANNDGTVANDNNAVLVSQNNRYETGWACKSILNVTGGTFKGGYNCYGMGPGVEPDDAQINIKGGNFNADPASYVVAGYEIADENGIYTVRKPEALAKFEADIAKGGEVKLTEDIALLEPVVIESGKTVVLNLNGKTISGNWHKNNGAIIKNNGTLTIVGGIISSTGKNGGSAVQNNGTLTVNNATLNGAPNADGSWPSYSVNNIGTMTVENTTITSYHGAVASYGDGAVVTLNNCTIDMAGIPGFTSHGIYTYNNGKVVVNDGTYENKATDQASSGASVINGAVEVNAGTFSGRIENYYGTPVLKGGTFSVKPNAKFIAAGYEVVEENGRWIVREQ